MRILLRRPLRDHPPRRAELVEQLLAELYERGRDAADLHELLLHAAQLEREALPAIADLDGVVQGVDVDLRAVLRRLEEGVVVYRDAQKTQARLVSAVYEGEGSRDYAFHAAA